MTKIEYFRLEESPYQPGKYTLTLDFEKTPPMSTIGSYNLLPARILNLSYAQYLRFCRDIVGAELSGKGTLYPIAYFNKSVQTNAFLRLLNNQMYLIMWEREHPDWRSHQSYLELKETQKQEQRKAREEKKNVSHK